MIKKFITLFIFTGILYSALASAEPAPPLRLTVTPDKSEYKIGEEIIVDVELTNIDPRKLQVIDLDRAGHALMSGQVFLFEIIDPQGNKLPFLGAVTDYWPGDRNIWIDPQTTLKTKVILNSRQPGDVAYYKFDKVGKYKISLQYSDNFEYQDYSGTIKHKYGYSVPVEINVVK